MTLFILSSVITSCSKEHEFGNLSQPDIAVSQFTPQCNQGLNIDTTIHVKIALMALNIANDEYFNQKIALLLQESNPTEQKYYDILGFQGLELTSSEVDYLQSLENDATAKETFYKDVERQFDCLNKKSVQIRAGFWTTIGKVGLAALNVGLLCVTPPTCIVACGTAAGLLGSAYCDFYPNQC